VVSFGKVFEHIVQVIDRVGGRCLGIGGGAYLIGLGGSPEATYCSWALSAISPCSSRICSARYSLFARFKFQYGHYISARLYFGPGSSSDVSDSVSSSSTTGSSFLIIFFSAFSTFSGLSSCPRFIAVYLAKSTLSTVNVWFSLFCVRFV
jgi:hypothetical protein